MALFGFYSSLPTAPVLESDILQLRLPDLRDYHNWSRLREASRAFLTPWEPLWPDDDLTLSAYRRRVRRCQQEFERQEAFTFFLFRKIDKQLLGGLTVGNIRLGAAQAATLGYWMGEGFAGQGYMAHAVRLAAKFAFGNLRMHRLEAACITHNEPSMRLLEAVGFKREGLARAYFRIADIWQDHYLYALLESDQIFDRPFKPLFRQSRKS